MQAQKTSNPKDYLLEPQKLNDLQCTICSQSSLHYLRCKTCKLILCYQCAIDQKAKHNKCPFRCSQIFQMQIFDLQQKYKCQFSQHCKQISSTIKQFFEHGRHCKFITKEQVEKQNNKWNYVCMNNHTLQVKIDSYSKLIQRKKCAQCNQYKLSRSICRKCQQQYCGNCRPFPIFNMHCPMNHQLIQRTIKTINYRCDNCQLAPIILNLKIYDDFTCNIGLCQNCFKDLPQFKHPIQYSQNISSYCNKIGDPKVIQKTIKMQYSQMKTQHKLKLMKQFTVKKCSCCLHQRICYKECEKCQQFYCIDCKKYEADQLYKCELRHSFILLSQQQKQNKQCLGCISKMQKVQSKEPELCYDEECKLCLCKQCITQMICYNFDVKYKQISLRVNHCKFDTSHILFFLPTNYNSKGFCSSCNKYSPLKFNCGMCQSSKFYCCACVPPPDITKCYCLKQMKKVEYQQQTLISCLICLKQAIAQNQQNFYQCESCEYFICQKCKNSHQMLKQSDNIIEKL